MLNHHSFCSSLLFLFFLMELNDKFMSLVGVFPFCRTDKMYIVKAINQIDFSYLFYLFLFRASFFLRFFFFL
ncbi:hypothetical protein STCU_10010 [Strigomonas culicis]|uniref:Uncharacterized protein n=1 Tax=Strigomonas culicis TaxID=28005 RepID=S9TNT3_9TRYP|nr:hypothetical protein STCU_10010 [Strigomonas culicis]|eukprot:EPY18369.1 hypothetical protein STCU_10010 [Strigomonas culicis]